MAGFDWLASGRVDEYWFDMVSINSLKVIGKLEGITSGQISWDYNSTEKVSGTLTVTDAYFINNCLIRVWLGCTPSGSSKTKWVELCTCLASTESGHYENGKYSGTINLRGVLARFTDDVLESPYTHGKGNSAYERYKAMFRWLGGCWKWGNLKDKNFTKTRVFDFGTSAMEPMQHIADTVGGQLTCDTHGNVVMVPYVSPGSKPVSYAIKADGKSVVLNGIDEQYSLAGTVNRYAVRYQYKYVTFVANGTYSADTTDKDGTHHSKGDTKYKKQTQDRVLYGLATSKSTWATAYAKTGRYITETWDVTSVSNPVAEGATIAQRDAAEAEIKKELDAKAAKWLASAATWHKRYTFRTCTYLPFAVGDVINFRYDKFNVDGLVEKIDYNLVPGCPMTVTIRKVRGNDG